MQHTIHSALREAYQSMFGQRILNSNIHVHLNPSFRESGLVQQQQHPQANKNQPGSTCRILFLSVKSNRFMIKALNIACQSSGYLLGKECRKNGKHCSWSFLCARRYVNTLNLPGKLSPEQIFPLCIVL